MSAATERLLYYDRQYLRARDFEAEQRYHTEMRRRLNLALHLYGIVDGLEVAKAEITPGAGDEYHVTPGMAIDVFGREILLFTPYVLNEDVLRDNSAIHPSTYTVYAAYERTATTPPAPGYRDCQIDPQYTRWRESARILVTREAAPQLKPEITGELSDDPKEDPWWIVLGSITVALDMQNRPFIQQISTTKGMRAYIGLRAQRIVAPVTGLLTGALDAGLPVAVEADLRAQVNLIVGHDFGVDKNEVKPAPAAAVFPAASGNARIEKDVFLQGELYKRVGQEWLAFGEYFKTLMPEMQFGTESITPAQPNLTSGTETITITPQQLLQPGSMQVFVAISGIEWKDKNTLNTWYGAIAGGAAIKISAQAVNVQGPGVGGQFTFDIQWTVTPQSAANVVQVQALTVNYIALILP